MTRRGLRGSWPQPPLSPSLYSLDRPGGPDAPILILDEATSSLDSESEALIQDALWKLLAGRTAIVIAHRLSTVKRLDELIIFDGGRIAERGAHDELLARGGIYAALWAHQSGGFLVQEPVSRGSQ